ncbi:MAG: hypothetical protein H6559_02445 [Lewinellaceae bacterium]|nr:hypothetical protein [Lewinellaceae bacterium]
MTASKTAISPPIHPYPSSRPHIHRHSIPDQLIGEGRKQQFSQVKILEQEGLSNLSIFTLKKIKKPGNIFPGSGISCRISEGNVEWLQKKDLQKLKKLSKDYHHEKKKHVFPLGDALHTNSICPGSSFF